MVFNGFATGTASQTTPSPRPCSTDCFTRGGERFPEITAHSDRSGSHSAGALLGGGMGERLAGVTKSTGSLTHTITLCWL